MSLKKVKLYALMLHFKNKKKYLIQDYFNKTYSIYLYTNTFTLIIVQKDEIDKS